MASISWSEEASEAPSFEELSVKSLDAAIELDHLQHGRDGDVGAIQSLATNLGFTSVEVWSSDTFKRYVDPQTVDIYSRALTHLTNVPPSTVGELAAKISEIAGSFSKDVKAIASDDLKKMRDFCLALHRELLAETYDRQSESTAERL